MEIIKAEQGDIPEIQKLVQGSIKDMNANGIHQWNMQYPPLEIFASDVEKGSLYAMKENERIVGIIVLSEEQDEEYTQIEWKNKSDDFLVVHRLAVLPALQRKGIASRLMHFAENYARDKGFSSIRIDTFSGNPRTLEFFEKRGYERKPGHIHFPENEEPYYCYEIFVK